MTGTAHLRRMARNGRPSRVVLGLVAGLIACNALIVASSQLWRSYDPRFYRDRLAVCRSGSWDLIVTGGSPAMVDIDVTTIEGIAWRGRPLERGFNLGLPLGTVVDVSLAVEHGLRKKPPQLLIYGVAITDLNGERMEPQGQRYLMDAADLARWVRHRPRRAFRSAREFLGERVAGLTPMAQYGDGLHFWAAEQLDRIWPGFAAPSTNTARKNRDDSRTIHGREGYLPTGQVQPDGRLSVRKARGQKEPPFAWLHRYDVRGHLPYLRRLLTWARTRAVPVVLVEMPMAEDVEREFPREFETFRAVIQEVAQEFGVTLLTPTRSGLGLTDAEFFDPAHLNADGVRLFSAWLRQALVVVPEPIRASRAP